MKRETKRIFAFVLLGLFVFNLGIGLVDAEGLDDFGKDNNFLDGEGSTTGRLSETFTNFFSSWNQGVVGANTAKIIFFLIIGIGLFLLLSSFMTNSKYTIWLIIASFLLSFLFVSYIAPNEMYALLNSYTAMGLTLITLIPLGVLSLLSIRAADRQSTPIVLLQWAGWALFALYLGYRVIFDIGWLKEGNRTVNGILILVAIFSAIMALLNPSVLRFLSRISRKIKKNKAKSNIAKFGDAMKKTISVGERIDEADSGEYD